MRDVTLLGSTGSIGVQALEVIEAHPEKFRVAALAAGGSHPELLAQQVAAHNVRHVAVFSESAYPALRDALHTHVPHADEVEVLVGAHGVTQLAAHTPGTSSEETIVLNAVTGSVGLAPTLAALHTGHRVALANKESLVAGGSLVARAAQPGQITPVDSEHSALAQALRSGHDHEVARLILTASGGPFRTTPLSELENVSVEQALAHPTWQMGPVVTINSATLMNKALEVIEAYELFHASHGVTYDTIDVVIHPQSIVHSMVEFLDGSTILQASHPDMRLPIAYALGFPERLSSRGDTRNPPPYALSSSWKDGQQWQFEPVDTERFGALKLAHDAGTAGGCLTAVMNAANEECVAAFTRSQLRFTDIVTTVRRVLDTAVSSTANAPVELLKPPESVEAVLAAERWARHTTQHILR